ncbi:hypothetical protein GCM10023195_28690 [Actinoallomurus liliacearum]|uniref:Uncharacterized protein n=1 Tax=Actinoallomurus liliacearum TaxID=1080073 RepID=A0ABP8TKL1_9ACTN
MRPTKAKKSAIRGARSGATGTAGPRRRAGALIASEPGGSSPTIDRRPAPDVWHGLRIRLVRPPAAPDPK